MSLSTMRNTDKAVEVIVHINESLDEERRKGLVEKISKDSGIFSVEFTPLRHHLVRVRYRNPTEGVRVELREALLYDADRARVPPSPGPEPTGP